MKMLERDRAPLSGSRVLVVANAYPSDEALYRNGFIHRRVRAYVEAGILVDVFYLHPPVGAPYEYVFDGITVHVGDGTAYEEFIASTSYDKILVHFATPGMISPIKHHRPSTPVIVWVHGFEAESWHRRWFNVTDSAAKLEAFLERKSTHFAEQQRFMGWLYSTDELDVTIVHVSDWFRRNIAEPDARSGTRKYHVIPNIVDTEVFPYREKSAEDRLEVLSIRPYASAKYANDLAVEAVKILADRPYFDDLRFSFYGDGALFDATLAPLQEYGNVTVSKGFLRQDEISEIHQAHGVFLAPTRFDSQGVSMCEAMASGLVPVTTEIAAIPEFVENWSSGLLAPPDDPLGIANMIEVLYYSEELFLELSNRASVSISQMCGRAATTDREIGLIES